MSDDVHIFPVHLSVEEWTAIVRVMQEHAESLDEDWDDETRDFYAVIVAKLQEGPLASV